MQELKKTETKGNLRPVKSWLESVCINRSGNKAHRGARVYLRSRASRGPAGTASGGHSPAGRAILSLGRDEIRRSTARLIYILIERTKAGPQWMIYAWRERPGLSLLSGLGRGRADDL